MGTNEGFVELDVNGEKIPALVVKTSPININDGFGALIDETIEKTTTNPFTALVEGAECEDPPVELEYFRELYRRSAVVSACVRTKVSDVVGQGFVIRPRAQLFPSVEGMKPGNAPDPNGQEKILDFLAIPDKNGSSFTELLMSMWMDVEVFGQGYIEIVRRNDGAIDDMLPIGSETIRIAKGGPKNGFWHTRGSQYKYYAGFVADGKVKYADIAAKTVSETRIPHLLGAGSARPADVFRLAKALDDSDNKQRVRVNELMFFKKLTPYDIYYGEPDILMAVEDFLVARNIRLFSVSYFDTATIPRLIIKIKGVYTVADETLRKIEQFLANQRRLDVLNKVLMLTLPEGVEIEIEPLTQAQLDENEALMKLRDSCEQYIMLSYRIPRTAIPDSMVHEKGETRDSNRRYVDSVVRPEQRRIEGVWNYVFREELGVNDWVIDLAPPDIVDEGIKRELWEAAIRSGWMTINEVRTQNNLGPIEGGDIPILRIAGQLPMPINQIGTVAENIMNGVTAGDMIREANDLRDGTSAGKVIRVRDTAFSEWGVEKDAPVVFVLRPDVEVEKLDKTAREEVASLLEGIVVNKDDVRDALGLEPTEKGL